jgi:hypothetical protein
MDHPQAFLSVLLHTRKQYVKASHHGNNLDDHHQLVGQVPTLHRNLLRPSSGKKGEQQNMVVQATLTIYCHIVHRVSAANH